MLVRLTVYFSRTQADRDALIVARSAPGQRRTRRMTRWEGAYKMPRPRMAPTDSFALVLSCTFHSSGMGLEGWSAERSV